MKKEKEAANGRDRTIPVRVSRSLYSDARRTARAEHRTIAGQIEYWSQIGRAALDNPDLPVEFVRSILVAKTRQEIEPFDPEE
ncbi:MAG: TA system antitoxin ParD family protein [Aminivibrio sp.]